MLFNVINWMMDLPEPYQYRYKQIVINLGKERDMQLLNPWEQMFLDEGVHQGLKQGRRQGKREGKKEGRKEGLELGLAQGRIEGAAMLLERLLTQRFGPLTKTARNKLVNATEEQIAAWSDALVSAQSLKQVFAASP